MAISLVHVSTRIVSPMLGSVIRRRVRQGKSDSMLLYLCDKCSIIQSTFDRQKSVHIILLDNLQTFADLFHQKTLFEPCSKVEPKVLVHLQHFSGNILPRSSSMIKLAWVMLHWTPNNVASS